MTNVTKTEETAAGWICRRHDENWTDADQSDLDAWLAADAEHEAAFWRLEFAWEKTERLAALRPAPRAGQGASRRLWIVPIPAMAAAVTLLLALPASWVAMQTGGPQTRYTTAIGGHQMAPLADGTRIELNTATKLRTEISSRSRQVWLDQGEAFFEVAHDAKHPFVVHAGPRTITVLGTKFSVRRDGARVQVDVLEGRVRVEDSQSISDMAFTSKSAPPPVIVTRGDVVVSEGAANLVSVASVQRVQDNLSWRQGRLTFDRVTLADAVKEFNRYNRRQMVVSDDKAAQERISGSFEADNTDAFLELAVGVFGLNVEKSEKSVKISS